jgi:anti-anti-sigma factor
MSNNDILPGFDEGSCDYLKVGLQKVDGVDSCLALKLQGQIDAFSGRFFQRSTKKAIEAGFIHLIFIMDGVDYLSSAGIEVFLKLQKEVRGLGGNISIVDIHPNIREIFKLMCLESYFSCIDSMNEAIAPMKISEKVSTFTKALECPTCQKRLRASKPGRFRCPACKTAFSIDESGKLGIGSSARSGSPVLMQRAQESASS